MVESAPLRVAVVGAGPAGIYAADALTKQTAVAIAVDVIDRLPTPFGLVRYGVAPDHVKIKSVSRALQGVLERDAVRFVGNVGVGGSGTDRADVTTEQLRTAYDAVVYSYGASRDRTLDIPGEDLTGSVAATDMVAWYSGHPDPVADAFPALVANARSAVVIGVGNVAVDIARILAKPSLALRHTDMPDDVLAALDGSGLCDIHVVGRRGVAQAKWTTKELRELGELDGVEVVVDPAEVQTTDGDAGDLADTATARNVAVVQGWVGARTGAAARRIHLHFWRRPVAITGGSAVTGIRLERTERDGSGRVAGTGEMLDLDAQLVIRSVGYRGTSLGDLPYDAATGTIPHDAGRILRDGARSPGEYVAGWIKRGPTGVIGTNRSDASDTVTSLLADAATLAGRATSTPDELWAAVEAGGVRVVELAHWNAIDAAEIELGAAAERDRVKLHRLELLLDAAHGSR